MKQVRLCAVIVTVLISSGTWVERAWAGVSTLPHFVSAGEYSLGIEPELTLTNGAGMAANFKYTQGMNDLMNLTGILGTGTGPRRFRIGSDLTFDFFPDISGQPGIGLGTQAIYYRLPTAGQLEMTAIPYIHKTFFNKTDEVEPYFSLPIGVAFSDGEYRNIATAVVGSMFKSSDSIRYSVEVGVAINNIESYFSGGITYYH